MRCGGGVASLLRQGWMLEVRTCRRRLAIWPQGAAGAHKEWAAALAALTWLRAGQRLLALGDGAFDTADLWAALPTDVALRAYAPGRAPTPVATPPFAAGTTSGREQIAKVQSGSPDRATLPVMVR